MCDLFKTLHDMQLRGNNVMQLKGKATSFLKFLLFKHLILALGYDVNGSGNDGKTLIGLLNTLITFTQRRLQ